MSTLPEHKAPDDILPYKRYIESALAHSGGTHTFEDICDGVTAGTLQFWPGEDSVIITEVVQHPRKRVLHFFLAGGNLVSLEKMFYPIMGWGKERGCDFATLTGRKGWERTGLVRQGWAQRLVLLETSL